VVELPARRKINWDLVLGDRAKSTEKIAEILGLSLPNTRRILRRAVAQLALLRKRIGRQYYYCTWDAWLEWLDSSRLTLNEAKVLLGGEKRVEYKDRRKESVGRNYEKTRNVVEKDRENSRRVVADVQSLLCSVDIDG